MYYSATNFADTIANVGALINRIGFWGPWYYNNNNREPQNSRGNYLGPYTIEPYYRSLIDPDPFKEPYNH